MTIKMKILLLDNYDSFTYNLLHAVKELGATDVEVVRNDQIELDEVDRFDKIILSPTRRTYYCRRWYDDCLVLLSGSKINSSGSHRTGKHVRL